MRKYLFLVMIFISQTFVHAESKSDVNVSIGTNPLLFLFGFSNLGLEAKLTENLTFSIGGLSYSDTNSETEQTFDIQAYGLGGGYYFDKAFTDSSYVGVVVNRLIFEESDKDQVRYDYENGDFAWQEKTYKSKAEVNSLGVVGGYLWMFDNGFSFNLGGGVAPIVVVKHTKNERNEEADLVGLDSPLLLGFTLGYTF